MTVPPGALDTFPVRERPCLILALGNELLGDDGVGFAVARHIRRQVPAADRIDIVESGEAGLALLEHLIGYERVVIVDSIQTGEHPAGTVLEYGVGRFRSVTAPSAHYAGLPEVLELGRRLGAPLPAMLRVIAVEAANVCEFSATLHPAVAAAVPAAAARVASILTAAGPDPPRQAARSP